LNQVDRAGLGLNQLLNLLVKGLELLIEKVDVAGLQSESDDGRAHIRARLFPLFAA